MPNKHLHEDIRLGTKQRKRRDRVEKRRQQALFPSKIDQLAQLRTLRQRPVFPPVTLDEAPFAAYENAVNKIYYTGPAYFHIRQPVLPVKLFSLQCTLAKGEADFRKKVCVKRFIGIRCGVMRAFKERY